MKGYELVMIAKGTLTEEESATLFQKFKEQITELGGKVHFENKWGRRKLAYEVKKNK